MVTGNWTAAALLLLTFVFGGLILSGGGVAKGQSSQLPELHEVNDTVAGIRLRIPHDLILTHKSTKWGSTWGSADGRLKIATLNFRGRRTLRSVYESIRNRPGRQISLDTFESAEFVLQGADADGSLFYVRATEQNGEVRGVSITHDGRSKAELRPVVAAIIRSYQSFPTDIASRDQADRAPTAPNSDDTNQEDCATEAALLDRISKKVHARFAAPSHITAGEALDFTWEAAERFPQEAPVYLVLAGPDGVRFSAVLDDVPDPANLGATSWRTELAGFFALPPYIRAPLGIQFGLRQTRAFIPLHQEGARLRGSLRVQFYEAGSFTLRAELVARTKCGERSLAGHITQKADVVPGKPEVVVNVARDIVSPKRSLQSNDGRYLVEIYERNFRVYEIATGAKVFESQGYDPNFSPASRFIVWRFSIDSIGVYDLRARKSVKALSGGFVGWSHGDAFLIHGGYKYCDLTVDNSLIDYPVRKESQNVKSYLSAEPLFHQCASWDYTHLTINMDNAIAGIATLSGTQSVMNICELASGLKICCENISELPSFIVRTNKTAPFEIRPGWRSEDPVSFSHTIIQCDDTGSDKLSEWEQKDFEERNAVRRRSQIFTSNLSESDEVSTKLPTLCKRRVLHKEVDATRAEALRGGGNIVASGMRLGTRGDWRSNGANASALNYAQSIDHLPRVLKNYGINVADLVQREDFNPKDIGTIRATIGAQTHKADHYFAPEGWDSDPAKIQPNHLIGAWAWNVRGKPVWLLQTLSIQGSHLVGYGGIFLIDGRKNGALIVLSDALKEFWNGVYGLDDQTVFRPQLVDDRYLVIGNQDGAIVVYDLDSGGVLSLVKGIQQSGLLSSVRLSKDLKQIIQINRDGQFYVYDTASGKQVVSGRYVDDEIIITTTEGYYWSSYEGAYYLQLHFPGVREHFSLQQFAAILSRPDIVKSRLTHVTTLAPAVNISPPPSLEIKQAKATPSAKDMHVFVDARSVSGLARVRFYQDGQLIRDMPLNGLEFRADVALQRVAHARWLTALAVDAKGIVSAPHAIRLEPQAGSTNRLHAVLVGVDKFSDPKIDLSYAKSDAKRLAAALAIRGRSYYADVNTVALLDENASAKSILSALEKAVTEAKAEDTVILFFAGHGIQDKFGRYYLAPSGFSVQDIAHSGLPWSDVAAVLEKTTARVVVVLDSCQSGLSGAEGFATNDDAVKSLLTGARSPMLVLAASKGRQYAHEHAKWGGGVFTYALMEILAGNPAAYDLDGDGVIEVSELYRALREIVIRETGGEQTPWLVRQDLVGDFALF